MGKYENRILWVDRTRGILMLSVVLYHVGGVVVDGNVGGGAERVQDLVDFIGVFFMSAFFLLSGLLWSAKPQGFVPFVWHKAGRLLMPYLVFGSVAAVMYLLLAPRYGLRLDGWWQPVLSLLHAGKWPDGQGFRFNSPLWFLPCMFVVCVLYWLIDRVCRGRAAYVVLFFLLVRLVDCLVMPQPGMRGLPWGFDLAVRYLQFFMIGAYCSRYRDKMPFQTWPSVAALFFGGAMVVVYMGGVHIHRQLNWLVEVVTLCWLVLFVGIVVRSKVLQACGERAMGILLVHKPLISLMMLSGAGTLVRAFLAPRIGLMGYVTVVFVVASVVSLGITELLVRVAPWTLGMKRRAA